jgi:hypothetical protein
MMLAPAGALAVVVMLRLVVETMFVSLEPRSATKLIWAYAVEAKPRKKTVKRRRARAPTPANTALSSWTNLLAESER